MNVSEGASWRISGRKTRDGRYEFTARYVSKRGRWKKQKFRVDTFTDGITQLRGFAADKGLDLWAVDRLETYIAAVGWEVGD